MIKKLLIVLAVLMVVAALTLLTLSFAQAHANNTCKTVSVVLVDGSGTSFISKTEIQRMLDEHGVQLKGKPLDRIEYDKVEQLVLKHKLVQRVECYSCPSGKVCIDIWQHIPVLRVFSGTESYYIDVNGVKTGLSNLTAADVTVATGSITNSVTVRDLHRMALLLREHPEWDALIEQICVEPNGEWVLIPRVGAVEIVFGRPVNMATKLNRIAVFMREYLPKMGWDTYSTVSVKFDNQIICTKKES